MKIKYKKYKFNLIETKSKLYERKRKENNIIYVYAQKIARDKIRTQKLCGKFTKNRMGKIEANIAEKLLCTNQILYDMI